MTVDSALGNDLVKYANDFRIEWTVVWNLGCEEGNLLFKSCKQISSLGPHEVFEDEGRTSQRVNLKVDPEAQVFNANAAIH